MTFLNSNVCPICSGSAFSDYRLGLIQCTTCDLVVSISIWHEESNEALEDEWFNEAFRDVPSRYVSQFERIKCMAVLRRVAKAQPPGRRLLEIGVGHGTLLQAAQAVGFEVVGCDLSRAICHHVETTFNISMHCKPLSSIAGNGIFDVIVMNHVLEHVNDPVAMLRDVKRLLVPNGIVHIAVPNVACWEARLSGWNSYEPYHLSYFQPSTLQRAVDDSGLSRLSLSTNDSFSGWFLAVLRTALGVNPLTGTGKSASLRSQSRASRDGLAEHAYRLSMIASGVLTWPLRKLQGWLGRGDEAVCIAKNSNT
jgi:2-polyprenyl-3-methyl-5-hydroxy-6-metoxy-1,4-benzoquinol methylase